MNDTTSTPGPSAVLIDVSRLRAAVDRTTKEVENFTKEFEYQYMEVEALGDARDEPEFASVINIMKPRESRLDATLAMESPTIANLTNSRVAEQVVIQA